MKISAGLAELPNRPHALYRFFDHSDVLLYVGITANLGTRMKNHGKEKPWWTEVHHISVEHYNTREEALEAERIAIKEERPLHNQQHNTFVQVELDPPGTAKALAREILFEIFEINEGGTVHEALLEQVRTAASAAGQSITDPDVAVARAVAVEAAAFWKTLERGLKDMFGVLPSKTLSAYMEATVEQMGCPWEEISEVERLMSVLFFVTQDSAWSTLRELPFPERERWIELAASRDELVPDLIPVTAVKYYNHFLAGTLEQRIAWEDEMAAKYRRPESTDEGGD